MKHKCSFILKASIALVLAMLVMVGSLSTVIAATIDAVVSVAEPAAAEAATDNADSADDAEPAEVAAEKAAPASISSSFTDRLTSSLKEDIAAVGANVDLVETASYGNYYLYYSTSSSGAYTSVEMSGGNTDTCTTSLSLTSGTTLYFKIVTNNNEWWGYNSFTTSQLTCNLSHQSGFSSSTRTGDNTFTGYSTGTYTFTGSISGQNCTLTISGGGGGGESGGSSDYTVPASGKQRVFLAVITYLTDVWSGGKAHTWLSTNTSDNTDTAWTSAGTIDITLGSNYWSGDAQTFNLFYADVKSTHDKIGLNKNDNNWWSGGDKSISSGTMIYIWEYGGTTHYDQKDLTYSGATATAKVDGASMANYTATVSSGSVSAATGTTVTASAPTGYDTNYQFDGWSVADSAGAFTDATALSTTFYPIKGSAVLTANFSEKTYTVTVAAGTGGSVNVDSISAKPLTATNLSTITVTPNAGYQFSGWTKTSAITLTNNSASDPTAGTIKASGTGTLTASFTKKNYTVSYSSASNGTFTVKNGSTSVSSGDSVAYDTTLTVTCTPGKGYQVGSVKYTNASGTATTATAGSGGTYTFNVPAANTTVTVTFTAKSYSISGSASPTAGGLMKITSTNSSSGSAVSTWSIGADRYLWATANAAYNFSKFVITYADSTTTELTTNGVNIKSYLTDARITSADAGAITVVAYFTAKPVYAITVTTSNANYGTATSSPTYAYEGQEVTLTASEDIGAFQYWSTSTDGFNLSTAKTSGTVGTAASAGTTTLKFTMPGKAVKIKAHFVAYEGTTEWYYNGYTNNNTDNSFYGKKLTAARVDGKEYSYYHVSGRSASRGWNQNFTISYGNVAHNNIRVKFTRPTDRYGDDDGDGWRWSNYDTQYAYFMSSDNVMIKDWSAMTWLDESTNFDISVPYGARYVIFKDGVTSSQTVNIDLKNAGTYLGYYLSGTKYGSAWEVNTFYSNTGTMGDFYEYFDGDGIYTDTTGHTFETYNVQYGGSHTLPRPNTNQDDYYILVLNPGNTYTINGTSVTVPSGDVPRVVWADELPGASADTVKVYAKDSAVRAGYTTYGVMADTKIYDSDDQAISDDVDTGTAGYETYTATKGETITVRTTINNNYGVTTSPAQKYSDQYYVRGFLINGEVPSGTLYSGKTTNNVYEVTYTIPEDFTGKYVEITPVYYLTDTSSNQVVTFYIDGFTPTLQQVGDDKANWGNTIYAYPFYSTLHSYNNAFGQYPGQPMIYHNGTYSVQIPIYSTSPFPIATGDEDQLTSGTDAGKLTQRRAIRISGITLHNGYYDEVHRTVMGYGSDQAKYQTQTYDYDDFYKIYHEKEDVDNIVFQFKNKTYASGTDNLSLLRSFTPGAASTFTTKFGSDFEDLVNFHGRKVNIYGDAISGTALTNNPIYVVSKAGSSKADSSSSGSDYYVENIAGRYATEWVIYVPSVKNGGTPTYTKVTDGVTGGKASIPPSLLLLNSSNSFSNTVYPSAIADYKTTDWQAYYNALADYKDYPVKITYEEAKNDVSGDKATRSDGRWLYSSFGDNITGKTKIEVCTTTDGTTYVDNATAAITGLNAYFTNSGVSGQTTYATTIDPDKTFNFTASSSNANYVFEGWYLNDNRITTNNSGSTERSGNYTFVARFRYHTSGFLTIQHVNEKTDTYKGGGTTTMSVVVYDGDGVVKTNIENTSDSVTLPSTIIDSAKGTYRIKITLTATPSGDNKFERVTLDNTGNANITGTFFGGSLTYTTMPGEFEFNVSDLFSSTTQNVTQLIYKSNFSSPIYNYQIKYEYSSKLLNCSGSAAVQSFTKKGTMTADEASEYIIKDGSSRILSPEFINDIAPCEENYGEVKTWTIPAASYRTFSAVSGATNTYSLDMTDASSKVTAVQSRGSDMKSITFELPYFFDGAGHAKLNINDDGSNPGPRTDSEYAADGTEAMFKTITKDYVLNDVPYAKVPKPRYNKRSSHYAEWQAIDEVNDNLYVSAPDTLLDATATVTTTQSGTDPDTGKPNYTTTVNYTLSETVLYFQYWSVFSNKESVEVARCYTNNFTFVALDDYTITPIYEATPSQDPTEGVAATISYLGPSRNQWNYLGWGDAAMIGTTDTLAQQASDLIFEDFVCSYFYHGESIHDGIEGVTTGYVVERIAKLDYFEDDVTPNTSREHYEAKYASTLATDKAAIKGYVENPSTKPKKLSIVYIDANKLDNKDRVQNFYSVYNSVGWDTTDADSDGNSEEPATTYPYKDYVYRAFAFVNVNGTVTLSDEPVYFTMYDIANQ